MKALRLALLLGAVGCGGSPDAPAQALVFFDTDAPVSPPRALVDLLEVEVVTEQGERACASCRRLFSVDQDFFADGGASIGIVSGAAETLVHASLFTSRWVDAHGRPYPGTGIEIFAKLVPSGRAVAEQMIRMPMHLWGRPGRSSAPDGVLRGRPSPSAVSVWPEAQRSGCAGPPRESHGVDDDEVCIEGGAFIKGNPGLAGLSNVDGDQPRLVVLSPFELDRYEYTVRRYRWALEHGFVHADQPLPRDARTSGLRHCTYTPTSEGVLADHRPLTCVNWSLASALCDFEGARLPTEMEWEFAASGEGEGRPFPWGSELPSCAGVAFARSQEHWPACLVEGFSEGPAEVGTSTQDRSVSGVFDLGGNVSEWTADSWNRQNEACWSSEEIFYDPRCDRISSDGEARSTRGGAWMTSAASLRSAVRFFHPPRSAGDFVGFRCARSTGARP